MITEDNQPGRRERLKQGLKNTYRVVVMHDETFEEVTSTRLTGLNVWIIVSTVIVVTGLLVWLLIAFTPLKRFVPGYGEGGSSSEVRRLSQQLVAMEDELDAQNAYLLRMRNLITGEVDSTFRQPEVLDEENTDIEPVDRIPEDEQLRRELELGELNRANASAATTAGGTVALESLYFIPPLTGNISAGFQPGKQHYGVDIVAPRNREIKSVMEGVVVQSGMAVETGLTIGIQHPNNVVTFYKHNSELLKRVGERVRAGEAIAIIGDTGELSDGPHLHFELWFAGKAVNPVEYVNFD